MDLIIGWFIFNDYFILKKYIRRVEPKIKIEILIKLIQLLKSVKDVIQNNGIVATIIDIRLIIKTSFTLFWANINDWSAEVIAIKLKLDDNNNNSFL